MWKMLVLIVALVACGEDTDPVHHENDCGGACPPDACGGGATCGDGTCDGAETTQSCAADCPPPVCNTNGTCDAGETTQSCAADCPPAPACDNDGVCDANEVYATCMTDCAAKLRVQNSSSYTLHHLYLRGCADVNWSPDQLGTSYVSPGQSFTLSGIAPGCWYLRVTDAGGVYNWQSQPVTFTAGTTYTWTIVN